MAKLYLQRHLKSQWNTENRFTGWVDVPVSKEGADSAKDAASLLKEEKFDIVFTSPLARNMQTTIKILRNLGKSPIFAHLDDGKMQKWGNFDGGVGECVLTYVSEKLNERYYGELQGLNKDEAKEQFGEEKVLLWRRSYDVAPPGGESLKDVCKRVDPFYKKYIEKDLKDGKNVLVVASHNSLRAIVKYVEKVSDEKIIDVELPFGSLIKYDFEKGKYTKLQ